MKWKLKLAMVLCIMTMTFTPVVPVKAAIPVAILEVIKAGVKKVIKAVDLKIQRLQNKTIWLQNAQKAIENALSKLKLQEISDWTARQKEQYQQYFEELHKVKALISYYQRIREITEKEARILSEYQHAWQIIRQDDHFRVEEIQYMAKVYEGILSETLKNIEQLYLVINSFRTQMTDAKRLEIISEVGDRVDQNFVDIRTFNTGNAMLSLERALDKKEAESVKKLYGLQ